MNTPIHNNHTIKQQKKVIFERKPMDQHLFEEIFFLYLPLLNVDLPALQRNFLVNIPAFLRAHPLQPYLNTHYDSNEEKNTTTWVALVANRMHHSASREALM